MISNEKKKKEEKKKDKQFIRSSFWDTLFSKASL